MKRTLLIIGLGVVLVLGIGASYKLSLALILNEYEEVCVWYQKNVTATLEYCVDIPAKTCDTEGNWTWCTFDYNNTKEECEYSLKYIQTDNCLEYKLVRKTDIEPFVYLFDWCTVYPDSVTQDCSAK